MAKADQQQPQYKIGTGIHEVWNSQHKLFQNKDPSIFMQRLSTNSTWTNKDLSLLNGIITSEISDQLEEQNIDQSILHNDDLVSE